ncbi:MAG: hypothetical protein ACE5I1_15040 [bacterium]
MKKHFRKVCSLLCSTGLLFLASSAIAQTTPVVGIHENTPNVVALQNAKIVVAPGQVLENATLIVRDGYIETVGVNVAAPADAVKKDMRGKTIYPGFIDLFSDYGIPKLRPQARTRTPAQPSPFNPFASRSSAPTSTTTGPAHWNPAVLAEKSAAETFQPDDKSAKSLRKLGFTSVLAFPTRGIFRGNGALVSLGKGEPNSLVYAADLAQGMSFNKGFRTRTGGMRDYPNSLMGVIALIRQTYLDAQWYEQAWSAYKAAPAGCSGSKSRTRSATALRKGPETGGYGSHRRAEHLARRANCQRIQPEYVDR